MGHVMGHVMIESTLSSTSQRQSSASLPAEPWFPHRPSTLRRFGKAVFLLLVCAYFAFADGSDPMFLRLDEYTRGASPTPYQYRELMMYVFRALIRVPLIAHAGQMQALHHDAYRLIFMFISFVSILVAFLANRLTLLRLTADRVFSFWASFLVIQMAHLLLASTWGPSYPVPYDVPSLAFFSLGIYLIGSRRWILYYFFFILAVFNRETACFLTIFFAIWEGTRLTEAGASIRTRLLHIVPAVSAQAILWLLIKTHLAHKYALNPKESGLTGGLFSMNLGYNVRELLKPYQWPLLASVCAFSLPFVWLQRRWIGSNPLRNATATVLPLSFLGLMIVGVIVEVRIFADWIAMIAPCAALIVHNRFRPREEMDPTVYPR